MFRLMTGFAVALSLLAVAATGEAAPAGYKVTGSIKAPDALWDYATVDATTRQLFIGRVGGVLMVNLETQAVTPVLVPSQLAHGALPLGNGQALATNGKANTATLFDELTGQVIATIPTAKGPDGFTHDPKSGLAIVTDGKAQALTLINVVSHTNVGTIPLPGDPEFPAADGKGYVFDNIEDRNEIAVVDMAARKVIRTIPLPGCNGPSGLAYDAADALLISVCQNGVADFIEARTGHLAAGVTIGEGPDDAIYDAKHRLAFVPSGKSGTLAVIAVANAHDIHLVQTLVTQVGARTAALDPKTGKLYLPVAKVIPSRKPGHHWPSLVPGTFHILVVSPN